MFNLFGFASSKPAASKARKAGRPRRKAQCLSPVERLETRDLMSGTPLDSSFQRDSDLDSWRPSPGPLPPPVVSPPVFGSGAVSLDLAGTPVQHLSEVLAGGADLFKVHLQNGDFLALDVDPLGAALTNLDTSRIEILDDTGALVTFAGPSFEPDTGAMTNHAALGFRASATDDYYIKISGTNNTGLGSTVANAGTYALNLHKLDLAEGMQSASQLQATGGMFVWLDPNTIEGKTLEFGGPTGYGFGIRGNWSQTTAKAGKGPLTTNTYKATGAVFLETAFGDVELAVPNGKSFTVVTKANTWNGAGGEVKTLTAAVGLPLGNFGADLREKLGLNLDSISLGNKWTIQMGSQIAAQRGIGQVLNAVPYLVYADKGAYRAEFGSVTVTNSAATGTVILADPVDPMLYLRAGNFAFAGSLQGHINYKPKLAPSTTVAPVYGHVFAGGNFPLAELPITIRGDITMNLDANGDGLWLGGQENASQLFKNNTVSSEALSTIFKDIRIGANGQVDVGYDAAGYNFTLPLGQASAVYHGPEQHVWFKGASTDPWEGTVLEQFQVISTVSVEGSYRAPKGSSGSSGGGSHADGGWATNVSTAPASVASGSTNLSAASANTAALPVGYSAAGGNLAAASANTAALPVNPAAGPADLASGGINTTSLPGVDSAWFITATGTYKVIGMKAEVTVTLDDTGVTAAAKAKALGQEFTMKGRIQSNGYYSLSTDLDVNLGFGAFQGHAGFDLVKDSNGTKFTADVGGKAKWSNGLWKTEAGFSADLTITVKSNGSLSYAGTAKAWGKVENGLGSASFDLSVDVSGGNKITFEIPKIGKKTITLPTL